MAPKVVRIASLGAKEPVATTASQSSGNAGSPQTTTATTTAATERAAANATKPRSSEGNDGRQGNVYRQIG
jgi:hypothetical protein